MLKRFSTLRVSTLCISPTSTVRTGAPSTEGMFAVLLDRTSYSEIEDTTAVISSRLIAKLLREMD